MRAALAALCVVASQSAFSADVLDRASAEAFADSEIVASMEMSGVPGAIIAIVQDGKVVLTKGYGKSNVDKNIAVDAATTQFNYASIGKPMTAMATLQLAREGKLALDRDVNEYLAQGGRGLKVTNGPITLENALGHKAGFEDNLTHLFVDLGEDASMSIEEMNRRLVLQHKAGMVSGYDNQGYGMISLVLSSVTGEPFAQILKKLVFDPIGMVHARYHTGEDSPNLARCYVPLGPKLAKECPYPVYREVLRGAGGVVASADDMARFMIVLLGGGQIDGRQVVAPEIIARMLDADHYRFAPGLTGASTPFVWFNDTDRPEFAHSGHVPGFASMMRLFPETRTGILVSFMGSATPSFDAIPSTFLDYLLHYRAQTPGAAEGMRRLEGVTEKFRDKFVPMSTTPQAIAPAPQDEDQVPHPEGTYAAATPSRFLLNRVFDIVAAATVTRDAQGNLFVRDEGPYRRVGADLYENDKQERIGFAVREGRVVMAEKLSVAQYLKRDDLGWKRWTLYGFVLAALLAPTWLLYVGRQSAGASRRGALWAFAGFHVFLAALLAELQWAVWFTLVMGDAWMALTWRGAGVVGLALMALGTLQNLRSARGMVRRLHVTLQAAGVAAMGVAYAAW